MIGFIIGFTCLFALILLFENERRSWNEELVDGGFDSWSGGIGRHPALRNLFHHLDTTPGQERTIRSALDELSGVLRRAERSVLHARNDIAAVFRAETLNEDAMRSAMERHNHASDSVRRATVEGLTKVHEVLDQRQRERLANWLEAGERRPPLEGPYRTPPSA